MFKLLFFCQKHVKSVPKAHPAAVAYASLGFGSSTSVSGGRFKSRIKRLAYRAWIDFLYRNPRDITALAWSTSGIRSELSSSWRGIKKCRWTDKSRVSRRFFDPACLVLAQEPIKIAIATRQIELKGPFIKDTKVSIWSVPRYPRRPRPSKLPATEEIT